MKTSLSVPRFRLVAVSLVATSALSAFADQPTPAVYPQYASTYYPPQKPSVVDRIRNAGQNVGDFVRRKFYGESGAAGYQQPVYQTPGGYRTQRYNLDAPAASLDRASSGAGQRSTATTGFQEPTRSGVPKYQTPPKDEAVAAPKTKPRSPESPPATTKKVEAKQAAGKTKASTSSENRTRSRDEGASGRGAQTRYAPVKPSSFAKTGSKPSPSKRHVEEEPPAPISRSKKFQQSPSTPQNDSPPADPKEPRIEAKLKTESTPPMTNGGEDSLGGGIAPTIGGTDFDLTPKSAQTNSTVETEGKASGSEKASDKPTSDGDAKSGGSFMVGKKGSKPGRVVSPYPPYNELDITGLPTGSLALDPTTQKVFQVP